MPGWVLEFDPDEWASVEDVPPAGWDLGEYVYRQHVAEERWEAAARRWWAEHRPGESLFRARQAHLRAGSVAA